MSLLVSRLSFLAIGCGLIFGAVVSGASLDSALFNHKYEGDLPVADTNGAYAEYIPDVSGPSTAGGIMTYQSSVASGNGAWERVIGSIWDGGTNPVSDENGWTVEFRIKIGADVAAGPDGAFQVYARDGDGSEIILFVGPEMTAHRQQFAGIGVLDSNSNSDDFHVFRFAQDAASSNMSVWRDGIALIADSTDLPRPDGPAYMFWGDGGGAIGGPTIEIDYFRWDSTGAYSPVVEGLVGDFNENNVVDAADYTVWRDNLDSTNALPNDNGLGGIVGSAHYDLWKANFGNSSLGSGGSIGAVPEPGSFLLTTVGLAMVVACRQRIRLV